MTKRQDIVRTLGNVPGVRMTALQIHKSCGFWFFPWATLIRLEEEGIVSSAWIEGPYPRKRVYWIE